MSKHVDAYFNKDRSLCGTIFFEVLGGQLSGDMAVFLLGCYICLRLFHAVTIPLNMCTCEVD
jgi:hypothetical protein